MGAVVRRPLRRQAAGAPQRPYSHPEQNPLRGAAAREGRAAETAASRRLQGFRLPLQVHPRGLLSRREARRSFTVPKRLIVTHAYRRAPGRSTFHRLQGAVALYLGLATIFA